MDCGGSFDTLRMRVWVDQISILTASIVNFREILIPGDDLFWGELRNEVSSYCKPWSLYIYTYTLIERPQETRDVFSDAILLVTSQF